MTSLLRTFFSVFAVFALAACGFTKAKEVATKSVETFHQEFNDSKFKEIYSDTTSGFKSSAKEPDFMKFIQAVRRKLGAFKKATPNGWNTNMTTNGTFVVLVYNSDFEHGSAAETFTFVVSGDAAKLQAYNINSRDLITN
jgi:Protein of unknown function (DUF3887)/Protein of unknown function (DUF4019)